MNRTKTILGVLLAAALLFCAAAATTAFWRGQITTENILTFGSLKLALRQTTLSGQTELPVTDQTPFNITSHNGVSRIVRVENLCDHPMYVRVSLKMAGATANGVTFDAGGLVSYAINDEDWAYENGWYYYKTALGPHTTSEELMTKVIFDDISKITSDYPGGSFDLTVNAQAVQSENNAADPRSASGWPAD